MNWNLENGIALAIAVAHLGVVVYSYTTQWQTSLALWLIRADLLGLLLYHVFDMQKQLAREVAFSDLEFATWALLEALLLGATFFGPPAWIIWLALAGACLLSSGTALFLLTFKMKLF